MVDYGQFLLKDFIGYCYGVLIVVCILFIVLIQQLDMILVGLVGLSLVGMVEIIFCKDFCFSFGMNS